MDVALGSQYSVRPTQPTHLVMDIAGRRMIACGVSGIAAEVGVPFEDVRATLGCGRCRRIWDHAVKMTPRRVG